MDEARKINNYTVEQSFNFGEREVFFGVDDTQEEPFVVAYAEYFSPMDVYMMNQPEHYKDYLSAMMDYCSRCTEQVKAVQEEHGKFGFSLAPFTAQDCIPCPSDESIIGKVVVMDVSKNRREYRHCAYQLVLAEAGNGASGGRGSAVFGTCLATGEKARWERYEVLGEIKPEKMPFWAKDALKSIQEKTAAEKSARKRHGEAR